MQEGWLKQSRWATSDCWKLVARARVSAVKLRHKSTAQSQRVVTRVCRAADCPELVANQYRSECAVVVAKVVRMNG